LTLIEALAIQMLDMGPVLWMFYHSGFRHMLRFKVKLISFGCNSMYLVMMTFRCLAVDSDK